MDCSPPGSSVHGVSRQEYWSGVPLQWRHTNSGSCHRLLLPLPDGLHSPRFRPWSRCPLRLRNCISSASDEAILVWYPVAFSSSVVFTSLWLFVSGSQTHPHPQAPTQEILTYVIWAAMFITFNKAPELMLMCFSQERLPFKGKKKLNISYVDILFTLFLYVFNITSCIYHPYTALKPNTFTKQIP